MDDEPGVVRSISWRDVSPWLLLLRVFRVAINADVLVLAFLGALISTAGWNVSRTCFLEEATVADRDFAQVRNRFEAWPDAVEFDYFKSTFSSQDGLMRAWRDQSVAAVFESIAYPFRQVFSQYSAVDRFFYFLFGGMWNLAVWSLFGLAIARIAAVKFGRGEIVRGKAATIFAIRKWLSCFGASSLPLCGILVVGIPMIVLGLLMRTDFGVLIAGILWILIVVAGFVMAIVGVGLLFGWPLMWGAIASEGTDSFDAISRTYSYTYQKPLHYLFYAVVVSILGFLGWCVVFLFIEMMVTFSATFVTWGCGAARWDEWAAATSGQGSEMLNAGRILIEFFHRIVRSILTAFSYGFFWASASGIYLLLRFQADQTELDDIFFLEEQHSIGLPALGEDAAGVPRVEPNDAPS